MEKKNIFLLPTDKPSRLYHWIGNDTYKGGFRLRKLSGFCDEVSIDIKNQHIYITSSKFAEYGEYCIDIDTDRKKEPVLNIGYQFDICPKNLKQFKIIMTDDLELIKKGIQPIDDEFLEWFVKNPSCEFVDVEKLYKNGYENWYKDDSWFIPSETKYKILIPKEEPKQDRTCNNNCSVVCGECQIFEPKQETLEEFINEELEDVFFTNISKRKEAERLIELGAKWQAERMYSEEDMYKLMDEYQEYLIKTDTTVKTFKEWFEQFKKK